MATPRKTRRRRESAGTEYRFKIGAYTPDTMPMARLAEYIAELAKMLGEPSAVHFVRLERGSTQVVHKINREAVPKVRARLSAVKRGDAPSDAARAFRTINRFLREDDAVGVLQERKPGSAVIIRFPGRDETQEEFAAVKQHGSIDGELTWIGGSDDTAHITLKSEGQQISGISVNKMLGKQLANRIFEYVRLHGRGRWRRDSEGVWTLIDFKVESFEPLNDAPLSTVLDRLRAVPTEWDDDAYNELRALRHGPKGTGVKGNGGH